MLELDSSLVKTIDYQADRLKNLKVEIELKKVVMNCPNCDQCTVKTNGTQIVKVKHSVIAERNTDIFFKKYRYKCLYCNITFIQPTPIGKSRSRVTYLTTRRIMELTRDPRMTFKLIASELNLSTTGVIDQFYKNVPFQRNNLPFALSIDEVYLGRKSVKKYAVVLMDFQSGDVIDLIYGRSVEDCMRGLQLYSRDERLTVKYISTDMYSGFHRLAKSYFPRAEICVDSFHVIKLINESFQKLLISKMKSYDNNSKEYYLLKKKRYLLLKNKDPIDWFSRTYDRKLKYYISKNQLVNLILNLDQDIETCYRIKERYMDFNKMGFDKVNPDKIIREELECLILEFKNTDYDGFKSISKTLKSNFEYIINSFTRINGKRISNGPIESTNAIIKMIVKTSGGYRNFDHLRIRALYVLNNRRNQR